MASATLHWQKDSCYATNSDEMESNSFQITIHYFTAAFYAYLLHKSVKNDSKNLGFKFACIEINRHLTINSTGASKPMVRI